MQRQQHPPSTLVPPLSTSFCSGSHGSLSCWNINFFCFCFCLFSLSLVWHYLIGAIGGGGCAVGADWALGKGRGAGSAHGTPRSRSSSCLPDWRAVDHMESSSLNTKPDSGELPGAHCTQALQLIQLRAIWFMTLTIMNRRLKFREKIFLLRWEILVNFHNVICHFE